jgi:quercetin dioxygenase-like cupin family protein
MRVLPLARALAVIGLLGVGARPAPPPEPAVTTLLETDRTILGQPFEYPEGEAKITAVVVTVPRGAVLPLHLHPVPVFAYVLEGELRVDYGAAGARTYRKGDALIEAFDSPHTGSNAGRRTVKVLVVYAGAGGLANTQPVAAVEPAP